MSSLIVQVRTITGIRPHQNPAKTRIEIAEVEGWQTIVKKDQFKVGDKIVYFPPDTVLPTELTDNLGVTQYTSKGRIRTIKLDKEMSFGLIATPDQDWPVGQDVADYYKAKKWEPPAPTIHGPKGVGTGKKNNIEGFHKYTDIENLRHFAHRLNDTEVVATLKIHGCSWRAALINGKLVVGSRNTIREYPGQYIKTEPRNCFHSFCLWAYRQITGRPHMIRKDDPNAAKQCWYYSHIVGPLGPQIRGLLSYLESQGAKNPALYGESFGPGIQDMHYGIKPGEFGFRAFDIMINDRYLSHDEFVEACTKFNIPMVPLLYRGPYSLDTVKPYSTGNDPIDPSHIREGIVVKPIKETVGPNGRLIFKLINNDYLLRKESNEVSDSTDN